MIRNLLGRKGSKDERGRKGSLPKPMKERRLKSVPAQRFNDMIDYYTAELKSRIEEIYRLKQENEMLIKTSLRNASRSDEFRLKAEKLEEDVRTLQGRMGKKD